MAPKNQPNLEEGVHLNNELLSHKIHYSMLTTSMATI